MTPPTAWRLVPALGLTQIISWGSLYYSIAVLGSSMRRELGVSTTTLFAAYSASLLISALAAPLAGRSIDRYGGRTVMTAGSLIAALSLAWIANAGSSVTLFLSWGLAGLAMALTMYDAAFATLSQHTGTSYRTALTALTLMGGLASTVFWPLSLFGLDHFGWRATMLGFAALQLLVCLPLHWAFVPRFPRPFASGSGVGAHPPGRTLTERGRRIAFLALAVCFALNGFIVSVLTVHLITILQGKGLALATAVWVGSFFGPMQVTARLLEFSFGRRLSSRTVGLIALSLLVVAVIVLLVLEGSVILAVAFALIFGCGNGVVTIVRGTVPAEIFGRTGYGSLLGRLAAPALFARALAPLAFAPLADSVTPLLGWLLLLLAMATLSVSSFAIAIRQR
jgi:predicted MFS family arabinose efflux permease